ncbi:MAG: hypothetical protein IPL40_03385 [Proteobacteria bacterium]|nr:hypothetical protein [Pseudomonadota bacterium]
MPLAPAQQLNPLAPLPRRTLRRGPVATCALALLMLGANLSAPRARASGPQPAAPTALQSEAKLQPHAGRAQPHADPAQAHAEPAQPAPINWFGCGADAVARSGPPLALALLNFSLLLLLLVRLGRRPLRTFLDTRRRELSEQIAEATQLRVRAEQQLAAAQRLLAGVEREVAELRAQATRDADHERERLLAEAAAESQRIIAVAERSLEQEVERIKRRLEVGAIAAALEAAERLLHDRVTAEDRQRLDEACLLQLLQPADGGPS